MLDRRNLFDSAEAAAPAADATTEPAAVEAPRGAEPARDGRRRARPPLAPRTPDRRATSHRSVRRGPGAVIGLSLAGCAAGVAAIVLLTGGRDHHEPAALPHAHAAPPQRPAAPRRPPSRDGTGARLERRGATLGRPRRHRRRAHDLPHSRPTAPAAAPTSAPATPPPPGRALDTATSAAPGPIAADADFVGGAPVDVTSMPPASTRDRTLIIP